MENLNITRFADALDAFKLNWEVSTRPLFTLNRDGAYVPVDSNKALVRLDTDAPLSVVGNRYEPVQNIVGGDIFDGVLAKTGGSYVKGGLFGNGRKVYVQALLPDTVTVKGKDETQKLLTFITSHDASTNIAFGFTGVRIVCQNTYMMAMRDIARQVQIRHTKSAAMRLATVQDVLESQLVYFKALEIKANWLADQRFSDIQFDAAMRKVLGVDGIPASDLPARTVGVMEQLRENFASGAGIDETNRGTAWAAYNAFTEYTNHQKGTRNADERGGADAVRFEGLLFGQGAAMNDAALSAIERSIAA